MYNLWLFRQVLFVQNGINFISDFLFSKDAFQNYFSEAIGVFFLGLFFNWLLKRREYQRLKPTRDFAYRALFECVSEFLNTTLPLKYSSDIFSFYFGQYYVPVFIYVKELDYYDHHNAIDDEWRRECNLTNMLNAESSKIHFDDLSKKVNQIKRFSVELDEVIMRWPILQELGTVNSIVKIHDGVRSLSTLTNLKDLVTNFQNGGSTFCHTLVQVQTAARLIQSELLEYSEEGRAILVDRKLEYGKKRK